MKYSEQGIGLSGRYQVIPRTLSFLFRDGQVLFLRGAPDKRLWPNQLNGIGGHLQRDETPREGARREIEEETGLEVPSLDLRAIVHVSGRPGDAGICIFVFVGQAPSQRVRASVEGTLEWHAMEQLPCDEMVADLPHLLPRILPPDGRPKDNIVYGRIVYGRYHAGQDGTMRFLFGDQSAD